MSYIQKKHSITLICIIIGNMLIAIADMIFIIPQGTLIGGATGIGVIISHFIPIRLSLIIFITNVVLFIGGAFILGKKFALSTLLSTFLYPFFIFIIEKSNCTEYITQNDFLAMIYGGLLLGVGIGLLGRVGASSGGTDIVALILQKKFHGSMSVYLYIVDFIILSIQCVFSNLDQILYGVLLLIIETMVVNKVMVFSETKTQLIVISNQYDEIRKQLMKEHDIGVTMVLIEGGLERKSKKAVYSVIPNRKLYLVKNSILEIDKNAFITINQINEVNGRGFTNERINQMIEF